MQLYIPEIGDKLELTEDWEFALHPNWANEDFAQDLGYVENIINLGQVWVDQHVWVDQTVNNQLPQYLFSNPTPHLDWVKNNISLWKEYVDIKFPTGTVLTIKRIMDSIKTADHSIIIFSTKYNGKKIKFSARFEDCNNIQFNKIP